MSRNQDKDPRSNLSIQYLGQQQWLRENSLDSHEGFKNLRSHLESAYRNLEESLPADEKKGSATQSQREREIEEKKRREIEEKKKRRIQLIDANKPTNQFLRNR